MVQTGRGSTPKLVAAAIIVDELSAPSKVLAARRTSPQELAGGWEFPGGKVEPTETPLCALHRELGEELGVGLDVGSELISAKGSAWSLNNGLEMRLWFARISAGEAAPLQDHDELRWLTPSQLHTVPWLPADVPILPYLFRHSKPATTPERITELTPGEVFVFGSNAHGSHGAGAARLAQERFGAQPGIGEGLSGQSYGVPTMGGWHEITQSSANFVEFAQQHPGLVFYLTKVGCGIAGYEECQIAPLFASAPPNVIKPKGW